MVMINLIILLIWPIKLSMCFCKEIFGVRFWLGFEGEIQ